MRRLSTRLLAATLTSSLLSTGALVSVASASDLNPGDFQVNTNNGPRGNNGPGGAPPTVTARVFSQVAMPRSVFAQWLKGALSLIGKLDDKETFGWSEIRKVVAGEDAQH